MPVNSNLLAKSLFEFEKKFAEPLSKLQINGFVAWPLVKTPVYFGLLAAQSRGQEVTGNSSMSVSARAGNQLNKIGRIAGMLLQLTRFRIFRRRTQVLFYSYAADKQVKNEQGRYYNWLIDPFITEKIIDHYFYAEQSINNLVKEPSEIKPHINLSAIDSLASFYRKKYTRSKELKEVSARLFEILAAHLKSAGFESDVSQNSIQTILLGFLGDYHAHRFFLKRLSPRFIIASERPASGILAASNSLGIPSMDLQHGVIDKHHPQYIYTAGLKPVKNKMAMPSFVGVLGELHKKILLQQGFWQTEEVVVLGNSRVEKNREKYKSQQDVVTGNRKKILIPTQWNIAGEMKLLLQTMVTQLAPGFEIVIKIHPLEPQVNIDFYHNLASSYPQKISIADRNMDIYALIDQAFLVIGFDSAALLEAIALSKPCITVTTANMPDGIHSMYDDEILKEAIKPVALDNEKGLIELIAQAGQKQFYDEWKRSATKQGSYLYAENYTQNCRAFINNFFSRFNS